MARVAADWQLWWLRICPPRLRADDEVLVHDMYKYNLDISNAGYKRRSCPAFPRIASSATFWLQRAIQPESNHPFV